MDGKIIAYLVFLFGIFGVIFGVYYTMDIDDVTKEMSLAQQQVNSMDTSISSEKNILEWRRELAAMLKVTEIMSNEQDAIRSELRGLQQRETELGRTFLLAIQRVREEAIGTVLDTIPLNNGVILKAARIQNIDEDIMTVLHSEGVSKVPTENLPSELKDRFRFGSGAGAAGATNQSNGSLPAFETPSYRTGPKYSVSDRVASTGSSIYSVTADPGAANKKVAAANARASEKGDPSVEGNPALWKSVTRHSLNRAYIPGQGWLEVGTKGPISDTARK